MNILTLIEAMVMWAEKQGPFVTKLSETAIPSIQEAVSAAKEGNWSDAATNIWPTIQSIAAENHMTIPALGQILPRIISAKDALDKMLPIVENIVEVFTADLIPDGRGGFVTKEWAEDPRHQLNPDGTFKN